MPEHHRRAVGTRVSTCKWRHSCHCPPSKTGPDQAQMLWPLSVAVLCLGSPSRVGLGVYTERWPGPASQSLEAMSTWPRCPGEALVYTVATTDPGPPSTWHAASPPRAGLDARAPCPGHHPAYRQMGQSQCGASTGLPPFLLTGTAGCHPRLQHQRTQGPHPSSGLDWLWDLGQGTSPTGASVKRD